MMSLQVRLIDPRGQRFGAVPSALAPRRRASLLDLPIVVALVGLALGVSAAFGTQYFAFGRPWPTIRRMLKLGPPAEPGARGRSALRPGPRHGRSSRSGSSSSLPAPGRWAGCRSSPSSCLQTLLAVTGLCLGCRLYGLHWWLPEQFDRFVLRRQPGSGGEAG